VSGGKVCDECGFLIVEGHEHDIIKPNHVVAYFHPECCPECLKALNPSKEQEP
jgi:hypothetical protein